ncbi:MAG: hypothetical protein KJ649_13930 [Proteobacteria bacterium]|nr:hypothetical protein [Pseudomonadota bacterium]
MRSVKNGGLLVLLLLCLGVLSCSGSLFRNYGQILPGGEVTRDLEHGVFHPELRYYTSGSDLYPNALIGLHRDYRLDPETLWKEVSMTPGKLREIVGFMKAKAFEYGQFPYEFELLDTGGKKIGFWYSLLKARTFLRFEEDGTVMIQTPDLDTYEKLEYKEDKNNL